MSAHRDEQQRPLLQEEEEEEERAYDPDEKVHIIGVDESPDGDEYSTRAPPFSWRKLWLFTGPGFLMSIAFLDPGNLEGDLQAGAIAGYSLLWLLLWATAMGLLVQLLAARLGVATGRHLAELCRDEYPNWARLLLWVMAELALIGSDIQEVIGSAIAIKILSQGFLPLWAGVIITALDCFIFLFLENYGVRKLEALFAVLIATMAISFAWMFGETKPDGRELMIGVVVPKLNSSTIKQAVGVVGCIIMPHNVFLHSALVQSREVDNRKIGRVREALTYYSIESGIALTISFMINLFVTAVFAKVFFGTEEANTIGLVNAGQYLEEKYGGGLVPILYIWAIGLLAAGQSSTITGTYAGQFIMGGFLNLRLKKWTRALITRSCAIIPTLIVALVFDTSDASLDILNEWLNVLQSIQIPFALIPLLCLVSKEELMGYFKIGTLLQTASWLVAALVILINGYLMVDFFASESGGVFSTTVVTTFAAAYVCFIVYLVTRNWSFSSLCAKAKTILGS
ncbi:natural resistance-associated macrophage protein 3 [Perilla frutescens var. hirtella]|uniref:Natural resistance-associated macrophage protein 3 n=1 Tax=Perilla frutescens var. hirtella TaxID=608512 RepID=A0AAD4PGC0_PERFH|nr:natural resistance-associated macrophage protein 3 [Perilla frutescens var. frutescens]KAH6784366.1 natural resistance-associated macrophage protein 3 [Perilla frutescens var. hirtella]KAH6838166.1 natural resistance-associated macrophage protein 3 [Perilla frutescens var. hirtella]